MIGSDIEYKFFGRRPVLELLKRRVLDLKEGYRQNMALIGNRHIGKSALIRQFLTNLDDREVVAVYLDLENREFDYFLAKMATSLLYDYSRLKNLPLQDDMRLLMEGVRSLLPMTVQVIEHILKDAAERRCNDAFLGLMTMAEVFSNETGLFCVLIFDEFHYMEEFGITEVFLKLGKKIMTQKRCLYIMASSYPVLAKKILTEKLSLLFGNFETLELDAFEPQSAQMFVDYYLGDVRMSRELRNFLADFTAGYPLYLMLICRELAGLSAMHKQREIYLPILAQAVENTIFDKWGEISRHFESAVKDLSTGKANRLMMTVLIAIANGQNRPEDLLKVVQLKKAPLTQRLNRLLDLGIIVKNGNYYYFKDKLFKYWTQYVYQRRLKDVELLPDKQRREFKEEFNRAVANHENCSRKDFSSRIIELLNCFDNEALQLNGRKYKLPAFDRVEISKIKNETGGAIDVIRGHFGEKDWLIAAKKDNFAEGDLNTVLAETRKTGNKPGQCLIVSLSPIDQNARLKALQERFWVWSENEVNTLLTLFDKPFIA
ncbi:MAG: AAA family ATPase [Candidatus Omnitrophica bacterium]|nr:AAA family ATPase [Candidatus Omnitrophota bacterium]